MKNKLIFSIIILVIFSAFSLSVSGASQQTFIYDSADILSDSDILEIEEILSSASSMAEVPILFVTSGKAGGDYGYDGWYLGVFSLGFFDDSIVLVLNRDPSTGTYTYYLDTFGDAYYNITDTEVDRILDNSEVFSNLKSGNIKEGVRAFASLCVKAYSGKLKASLWSYIGVSAIISLIITAVTVAVIIYKYKRKLKSAVYPLSKYARLDLDPSRSYDRFIGRNVVRTRISSSSGSRGNSRGGGGGRRGGR